MVTNILGVAASIVVIAMIVVLTGFAGFSEYRPWKRIAAGVAAFVITSIGLGMVLDTNDNPCVRYDHVVIHGQSYRTCAEHAEPEK